MLQRQFVGDRSCRAGIRSARPPAPSSHCQKLPANSFSHRNKHCHNTYIHCRDGTQRFQSESVHPGLDSTDFSSTHPNATDCIFYGNHRTGNSGKLFGNSERLGKEALHTTCTIYQRTVGIIFLRQDFISCLFMCQSFLYLQNLPPAASSERMAIKISRKTLHLPAYS